MPVLRAILGLTIAVVVAFGQESSISSIRVWTQADVSRVILELNGALAYKHERLNNPARVYFDFPNITLKLADSPGKRYLSTQVSGPLLTRFRAAESQSGAGTRVVFDLAAETATYAVSELANPTRLVVEFRNGPIPARPPAVAEPVEVVPRISLDQMRANASKAASTGKIPTPPVAAKVSPVASGYPPATSASLETPSRLLVDPAPPPSATAISAAASSSRTSTSGSSLADPSPALPAQRASKSMTRALGLKLGRIVLDPGHGGHDLGTSSPKGLHEKDLVLDIAKRLGILLESRLGSEVLYTRNDDTFIALEKRTEFANREKADLFVSIHANSSRLVSVSGPETFFLNFTSSQDAMEVASRENASSGKTIFELQDLVKQIALNDKLTESREFAAKVQTAMISLNKKDGTAASRNRGVKRAPFVVLIGAAMPSILTEIGFLTNAREEALLRKPEYRQRVAEALFRGISQYAQGLSHFQVAQRAAN